MGAVEPQPSDPDVETRTVERQHTAAVRRRISPEEVKSFVASVHGTVATHLQRIGVTTAGVPYVRFHERGDSFDVEAGWPVEERVTPKDEVEPAILPEGEVLVVWHRGDPNDLAPAFDAIEVACARHALEPTAAPWAIHHSPLDETDHGSWLTEVVQPVREV